MCGRGLCAYGYLIGMFLGYLGGIFLERVNGYELRASDGLFLGNFELEGVFVRNS